MPKRSRKAPKGRNPFILDDVEVQDDYSEEDEEFIDDESIAGESAGEPTAKRAKKKEKKRTTAENKELAQLTREVEERQKRRGARNPFAEMTGDQLREYAVQHFGADLGDGDEVEEEGDDEYEDEDQEGEDYEDDEYDGDLSGYIEDLQERGCNLWMVKCRRRGERIDVKKINKKSRYLRKVDEPLPIGRVFCHPGIQGFYWVEAESIKQVLESLRASNVNCAERNIKMVPMAELMQTYKPRKRKSRPSITPRPLIKEGMNVRVVGGEYRGREGIVIEADDNSESVTVLFMPENSKEQLVKDLDESVRVIPLEQLEVQGRLC